MYIQFRFIIVPIREVIFTSDIKRSRVLSEWCDSLEPLRVHVGRTERNRSVCVLTEDQMTLCGPSVLRNGLLVVPLLPEAVRRWWQVCLQPGCWSDPAGPPLSLVLNVALAVSLSGLGRSERGESFISVCFLRVCPIYDLWKRQLFMGWVMWYKYITPRYLRIKLQKLWAHMILLRITHSALHSVKVSRANGALFSETLSCLGVLK